MSRSRLLANLRTSILPESSSDLWSSGFLNNGRGVKKQFFLIGKPHADAKILVFRPKPIKPSASNASTQLSD